MSDEVVCGKHGSTPKRYACRHAASGVACGWHMSPEDPDIGWCDWCEERRDTADEWTAELNADMRLVCTHCFADARARNDRVPDRVRGHAVKLTADEQHALIHHAVHHVQSLQQTAKIRWHIDSDWYFDDERRTLTFSERGTPTAIADVRLVGSYSNSSKSFQWSWVLHDAGHPFVRGVDRLPAFGDVRGIAELAREKWDCPVDEAWEMTALAAYVLGCDAVYRAPFDHLYWFMLLDNFRAPA